MHSVTTAGRAHRQAFAAAILALAAMVIAPAVARADVAASVAADLAASGVQGAQVSVFTPAGTSVAADDPNAGDMAFSQLPAYLSPNPAAPLPVVNVTLAFPSAPALSGVLTTPGLPGPIYTTDIPRRIGAQLAALEALKHAVAAGNQLAGVELNINDAGASGTTQSLMAAPNYPAAQSFSTKMDLATLRSKVQASLPVWAKAAQVSVSEDAAAERIVTVTLSLPAQSFVLTDVGQLTQTLDYLQTSLASKGADIGRSLVTISDPTGGDPLYASADDAWWTYQSAWYSPLVRAYATDPLSTLAGPVTGPLGPQVAQVTSAVPAPPGG